MSWPKGQTNGGRAFQQINDEESNQAGSQILTGENLIIDIPWGIDGYTRGLISGKFTQQVANGVLQFFIAGIGSDNEVIFTDPFLIKLTPDFATSFGVESRYQITFFDREAPGNFFLEAGGVVTSGQNMANPTMLTNIPLLKLYMHNDGAETIDGIEFTLFLSGD